MVTLAIEASIFTFGMVEYSGQVFDSPTGANQFKSSCEPLHGIKEVAQIPGH